MKPKGRGYIKQSKNTAVKINSNIETLYGKGVFGTPTVVVGNRMHINVDTEDELTRIIDRALKQEKK